MADVLIVPTGTANIASVVAAFRRLGAVPRVGERTEEVATARRVMLPGVGAFGAAMARLVEHGLDAALRGRISEDRPTICICVGHQLLFEASDESQGVRGLGVVAGHVGRFPDGVRVPQFGWNQVHAGEESRLLEGGWAYFANSYRVAKAPPGWAVASANHGGRFIAAMERGNVLGCQFHPELSGAYGAALLARFLELA
ncbi:MAG TPA: imidazole glycerol phosphate synthase subunit HisH [Geminicoccaceae bacterium]|nr:imidazole glycerol phosphate synthase subunit HisH [Geminicoccaceae bacterium]